MGQSRGRSRPDPSSGLKPVFRLSHLLQEPPTRKGHEVRSSHGAAGPQSAFVLWAGTDSCLLKSLWGFDI